MNRLRTHLTYANVVATLALVFAMSGAAVAAKRYVITSSRQIRPGAISLANLSGAAQRSLHGANGAQGPAGARGSAGAPGVEGSRGPSDAWLLPGNGEAQAIVLPAGHYVATGTAYFAAGGFMRCILWQAQLGGGKTGTTSQAELPKAPYSLAVSATFSLGEPEQVWIECTGSGAPEVAIIRIGALH